MFQQEGGFDLGFSINKVSKNEATNILGKYNENKDEPFYYKSIWGLFLAKNIENTKFNKLTIDKLIKKNIEIADLGEELYLKAYIYNDSYSGSGYSSIKFYLLTKEDLKSFKNNKEEFTKTLNASKKEVFTITPDLLEKTLKNLPESKNLDWDRVLTIPFENLKDKKKLNFTSTAELFKEAIGIHTEKLKEEQQNLKDYKKYGAAVVFDEEWGVEEDDRDDPDFAGGRKRRRTNKRRMNKSKKSKCTKARRNNKTKGKARNVKRIKRTQRHRRNRH